GNLVDVPASSVSGVVNTSLDSGVKIGANFDHSNSMTGLLDEVRISNQNRGQAWAKYSFLNQGSGSKLLTYDLEYLLPPVLPSDINITVVTNELMSLKIQSNPPATSYN